VEASQLKTALHIGEVMGLIKRWKLRDDDIVAVWANMHSGSLHIEPWACDSTGLAFQRRNRTSPHYIARTGNVEVVFIDERRFYRETVQEDIESDRREAVQ